MEQFDQRVAQEKSVPSPRMTAYHKRLEDVVTRLEQARNRSAFDRSLRDLEKSRDKRTEYVVANLEKLVAAQST